MITAELVATTVRVIATLCPDTTYHRVHHPDGTSCAVYVHHGRPHCLIGHALWNLGLIDEHLEDDPARNQDGVAVLLENAGVIDADERGIPAVQWLSWVQDGNDNCLPWSEAIRDADRNIANNITYTS